MKKHKFKVGDAVYCLTTDQGIQRFTYCKQRECSPHIKVCEGEKVSERGVWHFIPEYCHPTPEACAQALVDEFYLNNPKAP